MARGLSTAVFGGALLASAALGLPAQAKPGGCLKYGAAGAVAGHVAGGHGIKGAIAGCALGWYERRRYKRMMREQANRPPAQSL